VFGVSALAILAMVVIGTSGSFSPGLAAPGVLFVLGLFAWYVVSFAGMAFLTYLVLVGLPSWHAMKARWRSLRRPSFKW
jgi:hypothetical protein